MTKGQPQTQATLGAEVGAAGLAGEGLCFGPRGGGHDFTGHAPRAQVLRGVVLTLVWWNLRTRQDSRPCLPAWDSASTGPRGDGPAPAGLALGGCPPAGETPPEQRGHKASSLCAGSEGRGGGCGERESILWTNVASSLSRAGPRPHPLPHSHSPGGFKRRAPSF